jgi:hypothetical protein
LEMGSRALFDQAGIKPWSSPSQWATSTQWCYGLNVVCPCSNSYWGLSVHCSDIEVVDPLSEWGHEGFAIINGLMFFLSHRLSSLRLS